MRRHPVRLPRPTRRGPADFSTAVDAGVDFRPATAATGLMTDDGGRVLGVETATGPITASLVVGADGPHSSVARAVEAREYHVTPQGRLFMWGYFEGVDSPPRIWLCKAGDVGLLAAPTDSDLFLAAIVPSQADKHRYLADTTAGLLEGMTAFDEVADLVGPARPVGPVRTMACWHGYFRQASGPGWVLVGDAGHFKDPTPGQGIADAFRQVERLAPAITAGLADGRMDERLSEWGRWRDRDVWEMYWLATDMGAAGPTSPLVREMIRQIGARPGGAERFLRVLDHDLEPSELFTPQRAVASALNLSRTRQVTPKAAISELRQVIGQEITRRRQRRHPAYQTPTSSDATDITPTAALG